MPRKGYGSKTQSGAPAQAPVAPPGQTYGEGERQLESQRRMPLPSGSPPIPGATGGAGGAGPAGPAPAPQMPMAQKMARALQAMEAMNPGGNLYQPTQRPSEPITAGMPMGAGPGPEALSTGDRTTRTLQLLADVTGDPRFAQLADRAARQAR